LSRVIVFIDGSNLYHAFRNYAPQKRLDLQLFSNQLCEINDRLIHTHYYNVPVNQADNPAIYAAQQRFLARLNKIPFFTVHLGRLLDRQRYENCPSCSRPYTVQYRTEKGVDIQLATDLLTLAFDNQYDIAVLVSNDSDFVPVVEQVMRLNKQIVNAEFPSKLPNYLSRRCSKVIKLDTNFLSTCTF